MKTACGTLSYVAPEVLAEKYTNQCDLWSLGVIVFILLSGSMPFQSNTESVTKARITAGKYTMRRERWEKVSLIAQNFVKALLEKNPEVRLTAKSALEHQWIKQYAEQPSIKVDPSMMDALQKYSAAPKFRRYCLLSMAWLLSDKETAQVRKEFCAIDTDQQGTISLGELQSLMVQKFGTSEEDILHIFRAMDANHDDEIHYSEFLAAMISTRMDMDDKLLDTAFRNFDTDLSGYITADNLRYAFGDAFEGEAVECLIGEADLSGCGHISYPEFAAYVRGVPIHSQEIQLSYPPGGSPRAQSRSATSKADVAIEQERAAQQACCNIM
jgi:calcium-dependent protein kinase